MVWSFDVGFYAAWLAPTAATNVRGNGLGASSLVWHFDPSMFLSPMLGSFSQDSFGNGLGASSMVWDFGALWVQPCATLGSWAYGFGAAEDESGIGDTDLTCRVRDCFGGVDNSGDLIAPTSSADDDSDCDD